MDIEYLEADGEMMEWWRVTWSDPASESIIRFVMTTTRSRQQTAEDRRAAKLAAVDRAKLAAKAFLTYGEPSVVDLN
jgi:hypothetical protein